MVKKGASRPRVALILKRSAWRTYLEERGDPRVRRLLIQGDPTALRLRASHQAHERTVREVRAALAAVGAEIVFSGRAGEPFSSDGLDLVVTVGGDGTLLSASHSVIDAPILGINSAPSHSVGFFCGAESGEVAKAIGAAIHGRLKRTTLTRMKVTVNGTIVAARVLNDALFCHVSPAATARYLIRLGDHEEDQKSSGFWIGPAAGSTAAQRSAGGRVLPLVSKKLQLVVREPYTPHGERHQLRRALIRPGETLTAQSLIHEAKLFIDGADQQIDIGFGDTVEFTQASQSLALLGISPRRKWGER
jgi:NAD+ kinase